MRKILLFLGLFVAISSQACEFEFGTKGDATKCKAGDEIVINVKLTLTHRNCKVAAKDTKFKFDGIQVLGATEWSQEAPNVFTRQIKAKVLADAKKKISLSATRNCEKDGGYGLFTLDKL